MLWHLAKPIYAGIAHGRVGVESLCDGLCDDRDALFFELFNQLLLLGNQRVNLRRLVVEKIGNLFLFF